MRRLFAASAVLAFAVSGCTSGGDGDSPEEGSGTLTSTTGPSAKEPQCADIWSTGKKLPDDFSTCYLDDRAAQLDVTECTDGTRLIVAEDIMWARTGESIHKPKVAPLQDTEEYGAAWSDCTGE